jgi:hypothetical protein
MKTTNHKLKPFYSSICKIQVIEAGAGAVVVCLADGNVYGDAVVLLFGILFSISSLGHIMQIQMVGLLLFYDTVLSVKVKHGSTFWIAFDVYYQ